MRRAWLAWVRSLAEMMSPVDRPGQAGCPLYSSYSITPNAYASPSCTQKTDTWNTCFNARRLLRDLG